MPSPQMISWPTSEMFDPPRVSTINLADSFPTLVLLMCHCQLSFIPKLTKSTTIIPQYTLQVHPLYGLSRNTATYTGVNLI